MCVVITGDRSFEKLSEVHSCNRLGKINLDEGRQCYQSDRQIMNTNEILKILPQLSDNDLLKIAQEALRLTQKEKNALTFDKIQQQWAIAATEAIEDYTSDRELTAFTNLDSEPFYEHNSGRDE